MKKLRDLIDWIYEERSLVKLILLCLAIAVLLIILMVLSMHRFDSTIQSMKFRGMYKQSGGAYLVLFIRDGCVDGRTFCSFDDASYFAEGIK
jgi:hypothetical protein